jgi:hypothetical protein
MLTRWPFSDQASQPPFLHGVFSGILRRAKGARLGMTGLCDGGASDVRVSALGVALLRTENC